MSFVQTLSSKSTITSASRRTAATTATQHCPQCGSSPSHGQSTDEAQRRIQELEAQVRELNVQAAATAEKLANYEDELLVLRSKVGSEEQTDPTAKPDSETTENHKNQQNGALQTQKLMPPPISRLPSLPSFLSGRRNAAGDASNTSPEKGNKNNMNKSSSNTTTPPRPSLLHFHNNNSDNTSTQSLPTIANNNNNSNNSSNKQPSSNLDLPTLLQQEQKARQAAETSLSQAQTELEELTSQLFGQANEMVAQERKARARLEQRIQVLEERDGEKRGRLERLEKAVGRIERVRGMLG